MGRKKGKIRDAHAAVTYDTPAPYDVATVSEAQELQTQELEVLQAIYEKELTMQSSTPLYTYIFTIRLQCEATPGAATTAEVLLHFDLTRAYPMKQPPNITVEAKHGLSDTETQKLTRGMEKLALEKVGDAAVYDLVVFATDFIQDHLKDQSSFFDQMMTRQQDKETQDKLEEDALLQQQQEQARAQNEKILALIDAERKKRETMMKTQRRRRIHRSSIDGESSGSEGECLSRIYEQQTDASSMRDESVSSVSDSDSGESDLEAVVAAKRYRSRYQGDFKELGLLGRGGGGEVIKVRNCLDRQLYAVKKVKLDPNDKVMKKKILREVKTISQMQHRHIVRYFQAWIEGESGMSSDDDEDFKRQESGLSDGESVLSSGDLSEEDDLYGDVSLLSGVDDELGPMTSTDEDEDDWLGTIGSSTRLWPASTSCHDPRSLHSKSQPYQLSSHNFASERFPDDGAEWEALEEAPVEDVDFSDNGGVGYHCKKLLRRSRVLKKKKFEKLYIQMEFCEGNALREVIDKGALWKDADKIWTMFRQILEALVYIHRQGIIHRDIKPPNVFLDSEGTVKLGDFGLAVRPPKVTEDDGSHGDSPPGETVTSAILSDSDGSSAAELYGRLKLENLESTRVIGRSSVLQNNNLMSTMSADVVDGITAGVGTAFYRAPEQERKGQRYNQKVDLFSLGIMFFEMWSPPFTTLMERAQALTGLREKHKLPEAFNASDDVKTIILWLCEGDPSRRPNAKELLASPLLPAKIEIEGSYLQEALETLANPQGKFFGQLIDALVSQEPLSHADYTYDHLESVKMRSYEVELRTKTYVRSVLQKVFQRHGAVEISTPLLMPRLSKQSFNNIAPNAPPKHALMMLDSNGVSVSLPFDLTERLARFVARHNVSRLKCFQFDRVYRKSVGGGHPREFTESDFDIVWDDGGCFRFLELEGLEVVSEVIKALPSCLGSYYLRFNDARMTRGILDLCHVPGTARREVLRLLSNEVSFYVHAGPSSTQAPSLKPGRWKFVAKRMKHYGVPASSIEALKPFFLLPEDCLASLDIIELEVQKLFARNRTLVNQDSATAVDGDTGSASLADRKQIQKRDAQLRRIVEDVNKGTTSLRLLLQGMQFLQMSGSVCTRLDLGLSPRPERYTSGFIFQAILLEEATYSGQTGNTTASLLVATTDSQIIVAEGGRYDALISRFKLTTTYANASPVAAMGVRFAIDKIVSLLAESMCTALLEFKFPASEVLTGGRNVLVCSAGKTSDTMLFRMQIAMLLWGHGISADYLHPEPLHLEDLEDYCAQQNLQWMVVVQKHMMREKQQVKIRAVKNHSDADVVTNVTSLPERISELQANFGKSSYGDAATGGGGRGNDYSGESRTSSNSGGGSTFSSAGSALQPIFDVRVVDPKYQSRDRNYYRNYQLDTQKVTRRVSKWISSSFSARGDDAMKVLSIDLPFALVREMSSALMAEGRGGIDTVCANNPRYRKQLKYTMEEVLALMPASTVRGGGRERYVLLHSMVDDRYDMMSLAPLLNASRKKIVGH